MELIKNKRVNNNYYSKIINITNFRKYNNVKVV